MTKRPREGAAPEQSPSVKVTLDDGTTIRMPVKEIGQVFHFNDGTTWRLPLTKVERIRFRQLHDLAAAGDPGPLEAEIERLLAVQVAAQVGRVAGGLASAEEKLHKRAARVALIREKFERQPDRAACKALRVQVEKLLLDQGHEPSVNTTYQIDEIVEALVT